MTVKHPSSMAHVTSTFCCKISSSILRSVSPKTSCQNSPTAATQVTKMGIKSLICDIKKVLRKCGFQ